MDAGPTPVLDEKELRKLMSKPLIKVSFQRCNWGCCRFI
jgi:hypothetical protein